MRVQLILELLDRASRPLQAVRKAMDGITGSEPLRRSLPPESVPRPDWRRPNPI